MLIRRAEEMDGNPVALEGVKDVSMRLLVGRDDGARTFAMRHFTVEPGGHTPHHQHDWEHEIFILEGEGMLRSGDHQEPFKPGDFALIKPMEWHQVMNTTDKPVKIICLVPHKK